MKTEKQIIEKTLLRIVLLIALCIGLYRTDVSSILTLLSILTGIFWVIPIVYDAIFHRKDRDKYDGEIFIESNTEDSTNLKLEIYEKDKIIGKGYLVIKVDIPDPIFEEEEIWQIDKD